MRVYHSFADGFYSGQMQICHPRKRAMRDDCIIKLVISNSLATLCKKIWAFLLLRWECYQRVANEFQFRSCKTLPKPSLKWSQNEEASICQKAWKLNKGKEHYVLWWRFTSQQFLLWISIMSEGFQERDMINKYILQSMKYSPSLEQLVRISWALERL